MRRLPAILACVLGLALVPAAADATSSLTRSSLARPSLAGTSQTDTAVSRALASSSSANPEAPIPVAASDTPPAGRRLSANRVLAIAAALPKMRAVRAEYKGSYGGAYLKAPFHWQVSYFSRGGKKEIGQVIIDDLSGRVLEQWTGFQVAWTMARGYPGAFGRHSNALYVWLPLCVLFILPFINFRRLLSLLHLDLLVLVSLSVSLAFFNHAHIYASVPLAYPPLLYLLARMLALLRRRRRDPGARAPAELRLLVPAPWLVLGIVFLIGFRVALNVTDSNVIDVGYAGVIGAERAADGRPLYGGYPADNEHGDTYGPFNYEAYVPFQQVFGWSGTWNDLPAAHAAAIFFDLLATGLLFLIGRRMRGPTLGIALAYAWVAFPFTLFALESNSNDILVAALVLAAVLAADYRARLAPGARGVLAALAGLTKFAPLAIAPLLATHGLRGIPPSRRPLAFALFLGGFAAAAALAFVPALRHDTLHTIYERTFVYQDNRGSPFSVWGLYGLHTLQRVVELAAVALALLMAIVPRREDLVGLAAAAGAVLIATELGIEHWFYLYIPWFFPLVMVALLGRLSDPTSSGPDAASAPARSTLPAVVPST
ncbi:MAG TPA: glycosyltransferase 87 family protein [Solirubrobacteraceae bacterium]|jgi:hypothetical protein